jgi:phosphoglycolate phosphatase
MLIIFTRWIISCASWSECGDAMNAPYQLAILDFDGTLADSLGVFVRSYNETAAAFGLLPIAPHQFDELRMLGAREISRRLRVPAWKTPFIVRRVRDLMTRRVHEVSLFDGVRDVLTQLATRGVTLALVSSNTESNVRRVLGSELSALFRYYECGVSIFGKAVRFSRLLRTTRIEPVRVICIGDEVRDAEAAARTGIDFGAVTWGYSAPAALEQTAPRFMFKSVADLLRIAA